MSLPVFVRAEWEGKREVTTEIASALVDRQAGTGPLSSWPTCDLRHERQITAKWGRSCRSTIYPRFTLPSDTKRINKQSSSRFEKWCCMGCIKWVLTMEEV